MKLGWVSSQWPRDDDAPALPGLLPGRYAGGAELLQDSMRSRAPEGVELVEIRPGELELIEGCDDLVVAGLAGFPDHELDVLASRRPLAWIMSVPQPRELPLLEASRVVWASPEMMGWFPWAPKGEVCSGWFDTSGVPRGVEKHATALWAARDHPQKGRMNARLVAARLGVPLVELTSAPREQVLEAMGTAAYFILLPKGSPDPCPTTVIEAEIAGCEIIVNRLVGRVPVRGSQAVVEYVESLPERFYSWLS